VKIKEDKLDITKSLRAIEWLKTELLGAVTLVFRATAKNSQDIIADALAQVVLIVYLLGRRLGIGFGVIDNRLSDMVRQSIASDHELERWYSDLSALEEHLRNK